MALDLPALYALICGRGAQEKTLAELKGEFALEVVPPPLWGQQCLAAAERPRPQPGHGGPLCDARSSLGRLSYLRIGAK
jgi:hypothetical protein